MNSQDVILLVSSPGLASGNRLRENIQDVESLSETIKFTRFCEDAAFWYPVSAAMNYWTKPDEDDGFGEVISLCREYTLSRENPQSTAYAAIPGETIVGPVIEVHIVKIPVDFELAIAIPSPNNPRRTGHLMF